MVQLAVLLFFSMGTPSMIIDFHAHIFPEVVRKSREKYFQGEPAFELLYRPSKSRLAGAEQLLGVMDENGVDRTVVFGFPWRSADLYKMHNDYILEAVQKRPDRLIGFGCFDPADPGAADETLRCLDAGLSGIGELAFYRSGIDADALDRLAPVMECCRRCGRPVLIHTNEPVGHDYPGKTPNTLAQIYELVRRFPENRIVLAHWGGGLFFFGLLKKEVKQALRNVWFDTAASPYLYDPAVYRTAIGAVGADRILFGSDYPLLSPNRYFKEWEAACLSPEERGQIGGLNAARLLGL
jgi:hypothetical protein